MSLSRLLQSISWKLLPHAGLELETPSGLKIPVTEKGAWACLNEIFMSRAYDPFFDRLPDLKGWVDLGCNVGFFSLALEDYLRRHHGSHSSTAALLVDANSHCVALANRLLKKNQLDAHWQAHQAVLGPRGQTVAFHQFKYSVHSGIFSPQKGERIERHPTVPLSDLLARHPVPRDLIKIDIEGAEKDLFEQEGDLIREFQFGICEWHAPQMTGHQLEDFCKQSGFQVLTMKSQPVGWDMSKGDSLDSPIGMMAWQRM